MANKRPISLAGIKIDYTRFKNDKGTLVMSTDLMVDYLVALMRPEWRYEPYSKIWLHFNGKHWAQAHHALQIILDLIRQVKHDLRGLCDHTDKALADGFGANVKGKLEAHEELHISPDKLDQWPKLLNTPEGIVNLQTSELVLHNPDLLLAQITNVSPLDDKDGQMCPHYLAHINFITNGDTDLKEYFEILSGYCLTGLMSMQEFYSWYGHGSNGKSVLAQIWQYCMGEYATTAAAGQFGYEGRTAHKEQDMRLLGKRLVISEEISSWDINKLKQFTDGGAVVAREMHGKSVQFKPQCKLIFISNIRPSLSTNDYGLERRLRLIPFEQRINEDKRVIHFLEEQLKPEAPYILNRMVKAAQKYLATGKVITPKSILDISAEYFNEENIMGIFIKEECDNSKESSIVFGEMFERLNKWCIKAGYDVPTKKKTAHLLSNMGYRRGRNTENRFIKGLQWKFKDTIASAPAEDYMAKYE